MTKTRLCRLCGQPLELHGSRTARLTLCGDCRARILSRYTYRIEHHITGKETCCLVCGEPIPKGYNGYTTCSRACRTLLNSVTANYRKDRAVNQIRKHTSRRSGSLAHLAGLNRKPGNMASLMACTWP